MKILLTLGPGGFEAADRGHVAVLDWPTGEIVDASEYKLQVYPTSHKGLSGATFDGDRLLVASEAELLEYDVAPLKLRQARTFNFLNDAHHIVASRDRIWVCNSGVDCIEEFDKNWTHLASHDLVRRFCRSPGKIAALLWRDVQKSMKRLRGKREQYGHLSKRPPFRNIVKLCLPGAYRRNGRDLRFSDFRPHALHPNHALPMGDDLWITLWQTGELVSLRTGKVLADGLVGPHDGVVADDEIYLTESETNRLIVHSFDSATQTVGPRIAATTVTTCFSEAFLRGVAVIGDSIFVGFTARRNAPREFQSARVVELKRGSLERLRIWTAPREYGRSVFSIVDAAWAYTRAALDAPGACGVAELAGAIDIRPSTGVSAR